MIPEEGLEVCVRARAQPHGRERLVPLDAEGCAGPRLSAGGPKTLGLTRSLQLDHQALKRLLSRGSEEFCSSCDS